MSVEKLRLVILISGRGSNLQAILDQAGSGELPVQIQAVISNRPDVQGLIRAHQAGVKTLVLNHKDFASRADFDAELRRLIDEHTPDLLVLAGFMRIFTSAFVEHYQGRMVNIHPSLLPKFRGLHTHAQALAAGEREHGASVHFVTPELDGGPIIAQARVPVLPGDDPDILADRVLQQEHRLYPEVIRWFAQSRVALRGDSVFLDGQPHHPKPKEY